MMGPRWEPRRGTMTSAGEAATWDRCHLEEARQPSRREGFSWWSRWMGVPGSGRSTDRGWGCRRAWPLARLSTCWFQAQSGSPNRCRYSLLRACQCSPNGTATTTVSPAATSSVVSAAPGSLGRLGEGGPLSALDAALGPQGLCLGLTGVKTFGVGFGGSLPCQVPSIACLLYARHGSG